MKRLLYLTFLLLLAGCEYYDTPETYEFTVSAVFPDEVNDGAPLNGVEVLARNLETGRELTQITDDQGKALFNVRGGKYDIVISFQGEYEVIVDGYPDRREILCNGSKTGQLVLENGNLFQVPLEWSLKTEGFVIKELYSTGSRNPEGKTYGADKFIEIYNNSDIVLNADGLCIGAVFLERVYTPSPYVNEDGNLLPRIPLWSFVPIVPGSGQEHPVQPGQSIVIALSGLNHRDDPNGNPNSIDLSISDWEMYVEDGKYPDVPEVPNMLMQRITRGTSMLMDTRGMVCILFRLPSNEYEQIFTDQNNWMTEPGGTALCFMVPTAWVIDGVENAAQDDRGLYKRLPNSIDAGYIQHSGSYTGVSIKRKVKEVIDGRTVYMDTNNSGNDFLTNQVPTPGVIATN